MVEPNEKMEYRACADGSKCAAPWLYNSVQSCSFYVDQHSQRLFLAAPPVVLDMIVTFDDTCNTRQQLDSLNEMCYLNMGDACTSWYKKRFNKVVDPKRHVIPSLKVMRDSVDNVCWRWFIVKVPPNGKVGSKPTTHLQSLYQGTVDSSVAG